MVTTHTVMVIPDTVTDTAMDIPLMLDTDTPAISARDLLSPPLRLDMPTDITLMPPILMATVWAMVMPVILMPMLMAITTKFCCYLTIIPRLCTLDSFKIGEL